MSRRRTHSQTQKSDELLVREFQEGQVEAFDEIYRLYRHRVAAVARRHLKDVRDVEEVVQDTFVKAYHALPRFNGEFRTGAWLARIAVNTAIDLSRRNVRSVGLTQLNDEHSEAVPPVDDLVVGTGPDLESVLVRLPPEHARALRMRALAGASHVEIAAAMERTPTQVKALLHRARESFKSIWRDVGSGAAFFLVAGGLALWLRLSRTVSSATATVVNNAARAGAESVAAPVVAVSENLPA